MILDDDPLGKADCLDGVVDFFPSETRGKGALYRRRRVDRLSVGCSQKGS